MFESSWFQTRFFKITSPCLLWLSQSTICYCKTIFNTLLPRKNLDNVKISDPKSQNVEEVFLFLKINCAFHNNRWPHFKHQGITRFYYHFSLHSPRIFVAFASSYRNSTVRNVSRLAHRWELFRWSSSFLTKYTAESITLRY